LAALDIPEQEGARVGLDSGCHGGPNRDHSRRPIVLCGVEPQLPNEEAGLARWIKPYLDALLRALGRVFDEPRCDGWVVARRACNINRPLARPGQECRGLWGAIGEDAAEVNYGRQVADHKGVELEAYSARVSYEGDLGADATSALVSNRIPKFGDQADHTSRAGLHLERDHFVPRATAVDYNGRNAQGLTPRIKVRKLLYRVGPHTDLTDVARER